MSSIGKSVLPMRKNGTLSSREMDAGRVRATCGCLARWRVYGKYENWVHSRSGKRRVVLLEMPVEPVVWIPAGEMPKIRAKTVHFPGAGAEREMEDGAEGGRLRGQNG